MDLMEFDRKMGRRSFLRQAGVAGLMGAGMVLGLTACGGDKKSEEAAKSAAAAKPAGDPCSDLSGLTADERATRTTFQYKEVSDDPAKVCTNCNFWQAPAAGQSCGGCTLVKGPIHPGGGCISWVAILET